MVAKYKINYFEEAEGKNIDDFGLIVGENLADCTRKITEYYGEDNIDDIAFEIFYGGDITGVIPNNDFEEVEAMYNESKA